MDWYQNEELVEQILRTGMYAKLYDEETTYGYLTYLTYRVEDTLFTWKKKSDVDGFWADLTWEEYIAFLQRKKPLVLATQRVLLNRGVSDVPSREGVLSAVEETAGPPLHMGALYRGAASQPKGVCGPTIEGLPQRAGSTGLSPGVADDLSDYS